MAAREQGRLPANWHGQCSVCGRPASFYQAAERWVFNRVEREVRLYCVEHRPPGSGP
jgi:hypothetical protein